MKTDIIIALRRDSAMNIIVEYSSGEQVSYSLQRFLEQAGTILDPSWTSYGLRRAIMQDGGLLKHLGLNHDILRASGISQPVLATAIAKQKAKAAARPPLKRAAPTVKSVSPSPPRLKRLIRI